MKKCAVALFTAIILLVLLAGCSGSGQYFSREHYFGRSENPIAGATEGAAISSYSALSNAIKNAIDSHKTEEVLMIKSYDGDWTEDIQQIQREMLEEYPYGRYAVNNFGYSPNTLFSQTEIKLSITYKDSAVNKQEIVEVPDTADFERRISELLRDFVMGQSEGAVSRVYYFTEFEDSTDDFGARLMKCWLGNASHAVELREISFVSYPDNSRERIVEVNIQYMEGREALLGRVDYILAAVRGIAAGFEGQTDSEKLEYIYRWLYENIELDIDSMGLVIEMDGAQSKRAIYTAYGALADGAAAQSGYALAAQVLCEALGLKSMVVEGWYGKLPYYWIYVECDGMYLHFDPTAMKIDDWLNPVIIDSETEENEPTEPLEEEQDLSEHIYLFTALEASARFNWNSNVYNLPQ